MALPATDDFAGTGALSGNWTHQTATTVTRASDHMTGGNGAFGYAFWNADAFNDDQYAEGVVGGVGLNPVYVGVTVRASGTGGSYNNYFLYIDTSDAYLGKTVAGSFSALVTFTGGGVLAGSSATYRLEAEGTTLRAYKNSVQLGTDQTDSSLASGSAGVGGYDSAGFQTSSLDDWEGGNLGATGVTRDPGVGALSLAGATGSLGFTINMPDEA
jgi:hypothetical protein